MTRLRVELAEWETLVTPPLGPPGASDVRLAESLAGTDGVLAVSWDHEFRARIAARSWVGVVGFEHFDVEITPKLVGSNLGVLEMIDYASGMDSLRRADATRTLAVDGGSLLDLVCLRLTEECERLLRQGLLHDYVTKEDGLHLLRGRLDVLKQATRRFGRVDVLECVFEEFETNVWENQLLASALSVAARLCRDDAVRARARRAAALFSEAADPMAVADARQLKREAIYHRRNKHYEPSHVWAHLVLEAAGISDLFASGPAKSFAFLLDMNVLFEDFVTQVLVEYASQPGVVVRPQRRDRSIIFNEHDGKPYAAIIPDVRIDDSRGDELRRLPIDIKYKLYDERRVDPADVYQTFFYAYAYASTDQVPLARIVYPASQDTVGFALAVKGFGGTRTGRIEGIGVNVPVLLTWIEEGNRKPVREIAQQLIA